MSENERVEIRSKIAGMVYGAAVGDAVGYPVEFIVDNLPSEKLGNEYHLVPQVRYSDDTQMALAAIDGIHDYIIQNDSDPNLKLSDRVYAKYQDWYDTQFIPELRRAPGNTCMSALESEIKGTIYNRKNDSYGCGTVMRAYPFSVFSSENVIRSAFADSFITHGHIRAAYSSAIMALLCSKMMEYGDKEGYTIFDAFSAVKYILPSLVNNAFSTTIPPEEVKQLTLMLNSIDAILHYANTQMDYLDVYRELGEGKKSLAGWVADEALYIGIYSFTKSKGDFEAGLWYSTNHGGDSDSTGTLFGALYGSYYGISKIPERYTKVLETPDKLEEAVNKLVEVYKAT